MWFDLYIPADVYVYIYTFGTAGTAFRWLCIYTALRVYRREGRTDVAEGGAHLSLTCATAWPIGRASWFLSLLYIEARYWTANERDFCCCLKMAGCGEFSILYRYYSWFLKLILIYVKILKFEMIDIYIYVDRQYIIFWKVHCYKKLPILLSIR